MNNLKRFIGEHRKLALVFLLVLIVFIGGSITSALNVARNRVQEDTQSLKSDENDVNLTDSQKRVIEKYDKDTLSFIDTLSVSVWSANNGHCTLQFSNHSYVETINGDSVTHSYAINHIDKTSDGYGGFIYTVVFDTDTGIHVVTYFDGKGSTVKEKSDVQKTDSTIVASISSASMFSLKDTPYARAEPVENIAIKGLNNEITNLFGGNTDKLTTSLSSWCATNYPMVSEATWSGNAFIDWNNSLVSTSFTPNNDPGKKISVVYHFDSDTFEFRI